MYLSLSFSISFSTVICHAIAFFRISSSNQSFGNLLHLFSVSFHIFGFLLWANCSALALLLSALVTCFCLVSCFLFRFPSQLICICMHTPAPTSLSLTLLCFLSSSFSCSLSVPCCVPSVLMIQKACHMPSTYAQSFRQHSHTHTHTSIYIYRCACVPMQLQLLCCPKKFVCYFAFVALLLLLLLFLPLAFCISFILVCIFHFFLSSSSFCQFHALFVRFAICLCLLFDLVFVLFFCFCWLVCSLVFVFSPIFDIFVLLTNLRHTMQTNKH